MSHLWLRHEYKSNERRAPITPEQVGLLVALGHKVTIESSKNRVFSDAEYKTHGAAIGTTGSWHDAPKDAFILGVKEQLQEQIHERNLALHHRHIYFAHVFKGQKCTPETMRRFALGGGTLLDLEYLVDDEGKRIAAFSYSAGFAGAIAAAYIWASKQLGGKPPYVLPSHYLSRMEFIVEIRSMLKTIGKRLSVLVIGAGGRSGQGAVDMFDALGIKATKWGRRDTQAGGPFAEILNFDIMCNCIFVAEPVKPFLTAGLVAERDDYRLSVVADVSNDLSYNPIFGISASTKFGDAAIRIGDIDVIEIENLAALTPLDSSTEYADQFFPHLLKLIENEKGNSVWERAALQYFEHHDIPQLGMDCGRELAELYVSDKYCFRPDIIHDYFLNIFAKNPFSRTDRLYFIDYLTAGAAEILDAVQQKNFALTLATAKLDEIYDSPAMQQHHALLKAVNNFSRSLSFKCVKSEQSREAFFAMCDLLSEVIDSREGAKEKFEVSRKILYKTIGSEIKDPAVRKFLDEIESPIKSSWHTA